LADKVYLQMGNYEGKNIIFYDGVCKLCNGFTKFLIRFDGKDNFRFVSLDSELAKALLNKYNIKPEDKDSVIYLQNAGNSNERIHSKSAAIIRSIEDIGGIFRFFKMFILVPKFLRDIIYDINGKLRLIIFGRYEVCPVPPENIRHKFLT